MTLEQLSEGICSVSYLSKIEHGDKSSEDTIKRLCERLGISYEDVDNQEELDEINELLDEWYKAIRDQNINIVKDIENNITIRLKKIEDPHPLLKYDLYKVRLLLLERNFDGAYSLLEEVEKFKDIFTTELQYFFFHFKSIYVYYNNEDYEKTLSYLKKAEEILENKLNLSEQESAELYYQLSLNYIYSYKIGKSINYAYRALNIFEKNYNLKRISDCQTLLGICYRRIHNYQQTEYHYRQALKFAELYDDDERRGIIHHNIGFVYSCQGKSKEAIDHLGKSLKYRINIDPKSRCYTLYLLAKEFLNIKETNKAQKIIYEGLSLAKKHNIKDSYFEFKILDVQINNKDCYESLLRKEAIPFFKKNNKWEHVSEFAEELANYYYDKGQYKSASQYYRLANNARKEIK